MQEHTSQLPVHDDARITLEREDVVQPVVRADRLHRGVARCMAVVSMELDHTISRADQYEPANVLVNEPDRSDRSALRVTVAEAR